MKIKFCGLKTLNDIKIAINSNANYIGINFYNKSKRYIGKNFIKLIKFIPSFLIKVALFVNNYKNEVLEVMNYFDLLQFHGNENFYFCEFFKKKYIKSININNKLDYFNFKKKNNIYSFLLDKRNEYYGGNGINFHNFKILSYKPIIISGGININNIKKIMKISSIKTIDLCSSLEYKKKKNIIKTIRSYEIK